MISRPLGTSVWSLVTGRVASGVSRHAWLGHVPARGSIFGRPKGVTVRPTPFKPAAVGADVTDPITVTVLANDTDTEIEVEEGHVLREAGLDVYGAVSRYANCGGRGLCGTCGVRIREGALEPQQWHDAASDRWGYPRLSCGIRVTEPMVVELVEKVVWGQLLPD
ncbi:hypothetical protein BRC75_07970 [Halobacteriales archaeon QH_7_69_31]|nr:MAG: hypothetical protein BRC75_07970 [Halobacteriales archaeon QH_7_69_31]